MIKNFVIEQPKIIHFRKTINMNNVQNKMYLLKYRIKQLLNQWIYVICKEVYLWVKAIIIAVYVKNQTTMKTLEGPSTSYKKWYSEKLIAHLIFESNCYITNISKKSKWQINSEKYLMINYSEENEIYRLFNPVVI